MGEPLLRSGVTTGMRFSEPGRLSIPPRPARRTAGAPMRPCTGEEQRLVEEHLYLVRTIANSCARRLPAHVSAGELESAGHVGLIEAAQRFDPARRTSFKTFAYQRVQGAILDEMRARATYNREQHRRLEAGLVATPRVAFDSDKLERIARVHAVEDAPAIDFVGIGRMRLALGLLPTRERRILVWRHWDDLTQAACADRLQLSLARVAQLEHQGYRRLRAILAAVDRNPSAVDR